MDDSDHHHTAEEEELAMALDGTWLLELYGLSDQLLPSPENDEDDYGFTWPSVTLPAQDSAAQNQESSQFGGASDNEAPQAVDVSRSRRVTSAPYSPPNPLHRRRLLQWFEDLPAQYDAFSEAVANSPADWDPAVQRSNTSSGRYPNPARPGVAHGHFHQGQFVPGVRGQANAQARTIGGSSANVNLHRHRSGVPDPSLFMSRNPAHPIGPFPQFHHRQPHQGPSSRGQSHRGQHREVQYRDGPFQRGQLHRGQLHQRELRQGQLRQGQIHQGQFNQGQFRQGQIHQGQVHQGQVHQGQFNQGQFNQGQFNQGQFNQGQFNQGQFNQGQFNQGQFNQGQFNQRQFNQRQFNQGQLNQAQSHRGTLLQGQPVPRGRIPLPGTIGDLPANPDWSPHTSDTSSSSSLSPVQPAAHLGQSHQGVRGLSRSSRPDTGALLADSSSRPLSMPDTSSTSPLRLTRAAAQDQQFLEAIRGHGGSFPQTGGIATGNRGLRSRNPDSLPNRPSGTAHGAAQCRQSPQASTGGIVDPQSGSLFPRLRTAQDFPDFLFNTPPTSGPCPPAPRYPRHPRPVGDLGNSTPEAFRTSSEMTNPGRRVMESQQRDGSSDASRPLPSDAISPQDRTRSYNALP